MTNPIDFDIHTLSAPERLLLAQRLLDSVVAESTPLSPTQHAEMQRRAGAIDSGKVTCEPWQELRASVLTHR